MFGACVTSGLFLKRLSVDASEISKTCSCKMACEQKAMSRLVSVAPSKPILDLNHWRSSSIKLISAIGVPQMSEASLVISSKSGSGAVSSTINASSRLRRCDSFSGFAAGTVMFVLSMRLN